jgi:hypothetical protein
LNVVDLPSLTTVLDTPTVALTRLIDTANVAPVSATGGFGNIAFSISPPLPNGLSISATNGFITGIAQVIQTAAPFNITATDAVGQKSTQTFTLTVIDPPLTATVVSANNVFTQYKSFTAIQPVTAAGGVTPYVFGIAPLLTGTGLTYSASGILAGTPTATLTTASYTVTITDSGGVVQTTSTSISIGINPPAPLVAVVNTSSLVYTIGVPATLIRPFEGSGGTGALTYSVSPALPLSLGLNAATGFIAGTPTVISSTATYTITVTDSAAVPQSTSTAVTVVIFPKPITLTVQQAEVVLTRYAAITTSIIPVLASDGSGVLTYTLIPPTLPNTVVYDAFTGEVEGTPTDPSISTT